MQQPNVPQAPKVALPPLIQNTLLKSNTGATPLPQITPLAQAPATPIPTPTAPIPAVKLPPHIANPQVPVPRPTVTLPQPKTNVIPVPNVVLPQPKPTAPKVTVPQNTRPNAGPPKGGLLKQFEGGTGIAVATVAATPQTITAPVINVVHETGYSILRQLMGLWQGTEAQVQQLTQLQYDNGSPIIDANRRDIIMEIIGMLLKNSFEEILDFLTDAPNPDYVLWDQEAMDEGRIKVLREIGMNQTQDVGVKGVGKCRWCPSTELVFATRQTRSGDEALSVFVRCVMCQKQWRQ
jgi:hypothetical protein